MARRLETLFDRYRNRGDVAALASVFERTAPEILRLAMHFARHPAEAEDLLQETFLTAITRADAYDANRPLVPWLIGILRNHARALHRQRRRASGLDAGAPADEAVGEAWMDVAWSDAIGEAVATLPEPYRQVLVLKLRHDRTPAEIALLLDLPPATVRSQIHRGLDLVRRRLPPDMRTQALAVLPVGLGLGCVRERVLAYGAQLAVGGAAAAATVPLVLGGVAMKQGVLAVVLLVAVLAIGTGLWWGGVFSAAGGDDEAAELASVPPDDSDPDHPSPSLVGTGATSTPDEPPATTEPGTEPKDEAWPPNLPIPDDKGSVAGRIVFQDGTPLVGAKVALWGSPSIAAVTDEDGRYHIHADWVHTRSVFLRLGRDDQPDWLGLIVSTEVAMRNGELVLHDLTLERGIDLESVVVDAHSGDPLADVDVVLRQKPLGHGQAQSGFARTDDAGRFRFPYVPRGTYTVELAHEGYQATVTEYDLRDGALPGEMALSRSRSLVIEFKNLPEGAVGTVVSCDFSKMAIDHTAFSVSSRPTIGPDGTLRLDAPEAGRYRLILFKSSHLPRLEREVEIPEGPLDPVVWTLTPGARVEGTVHDDEGGPIVDARVSIGGAAGRPRTDAEGAFAFPYVPAGRHAVRVGVGTAWVLVGEVDVPANGTARAGLRAPGSATLFGRLLVGGTPMDPYDGGIKIRNIASDVEVATARPDAKGDFRVPLLAPGSYEVFAWCGSGVPRAVNVSLEPGEAKDLGAIELAAFERVPVRFLLPPDRSVPDPIWIHAFDASHPPPARMPVLLVVGRTSMGVTPYLRRDDVDGGTFWVTGLPVGRLRLEFQTNEFEPATLEVDVKPGLTEPFEVRLEPK